MLKKAVVLLSGGLDSTTVLAIAKSFNFECYTLNFDYGQRHRSELVAARKISEVMGVVEHKTIKVDFRSIGGSALTQDDIEIPTKIEREKTDIPVTYVPARNTVFLSVALGWAEVLGARSIFIGANAIDYSGYPDCRAEFLDAFQTMANLATKAGVSGDFFSIEAPILEMTKAEVIKKGVELGVDYSLTVSCYQATEDGLACGVCDSCFYRKKGFIDAGLQDVTKYAS